MYADDTRILFSLDSISDIQMLILTSVYKPGWNQMSFPLNVTRTQTLLIRGRKKLKDIENSETHNLRIVIDQEPVWIVKHSKYLRIEVSQLLSREEHIFALIKIKISKE